MSQPPGVPQGSPPTESSPQFRNTAMSGAALSLLMAWRVLDCPLSELWKDWPLLLAVTCLVRLAAPSERTRGVMMTVVVVVLAAVYISGQLPFTLAVLGARP